VDRETRLGQLASAILEGKRIDWPDVESSVDAADSSVVGQLKVVAEIAALHRGLDDRAGAPAVSWGHLHLLERVGSGTFGDVYRAWDPHLDREVALKLLRAVPEVTALDASLSDPARVVNEGRLLARVRHPHVITVYGAEPRDGAVGIWMEFIRGKTLHQIVDQQGAMSAREAAAVGADLCGALASVHAAGLLHRDVTARNVMREEGGRIVLMDFGAGRDDARAIVRVEGRDMAGTPLYMAPELFNGARADQRSDIYALGALLYYLVSGRFPVSGRSLADVSAAHASGTRTRLRDARPDLTPGFVRVVEKALEPNPAQRFQTAGELEQALEDPAGELRVEARPAWQGRGIYLAAALAVTLILVTALTMLWSPAAGDQRDGSNASVAASVGGLVTRQLTPPSGVWAFSNPSDDGRFKAGMVTDTGDVALIDLATGTSRALGLGRGDYSDGYASLGILSPDGTTVAVEWYHENQGSLRLIRSDGSGRRDLIPAPADVRAYQWSRDGSLILALVKTAPDINAVCLIAVADGAVRQIRSIGREQPDMMTLSPDGRYIAYDYPESTDSPDRDIIILDTHTNSQWPLAPSPGEDRAPLFTPDGRNVVFLSDRSRTLSLWRTPVAQGRALGDAQLIKDDVGRTWLQGFTAAGSLHYQLSTGQAEVYLASIDGAKPITPTPISPRLALSNFYPVWSGDGRYVAYTSERSATGDRELWVHDTQADDDHRVLAGVQGAGRPFGWSPDGSKILASGRNDQRLLVVDRATGSIQEIAREVIRASWLPAGIVYLSGRQVVVYDDATQRIVRRFNYQDPSFAGFSLSPDGRSALAVHKDGRLTLTETASGRSHEWQDSGVLSLGNMSFMAPHASGVAYVATRKGLSGRVKTLMFWGGAGPPRELLRASSPNEFSLSGWHGDGRDLFVVRWQQRSGAAALEKRNETLWRVPVSGDDAVSTGLAIEGLRDISIHPDGRRIAFNAGWKGGDPWVMENFLPK